MTIATSISRLFASLIAVALVFAAPARAEEPLWGEIASTLGKGFWNVTTRGAYRASRPYRHHGGPVSLTIDRLDLVTGAEYGLRPDLDLYARLPYVSETIREQFSNQSVRHELRGLGEMELGAKWRFRQSITDTRKDELALLVGMKLPTGDAEMRDANGSLIQAHLQPNSGNLGGMLGLAANRHTPRGGYWFSGMVRLETGSRRYRRGEMIEVHLSTGRRLHRLLGGSQTDWMAIAGLHLHRMGKDSENGRVLRDSSGSLLSAELGLVGARRNQGARLGILLPLHTDLGKAHAPPRHEVQASYRLSF